jgi:exodeoxyribonuclease V gamma subunit
LYDNLRQTIDAFVGKTKEYMGGESLEPVEVDLKVNGFHITGSIAGVYTGGFLQYRYAGVKAKDHMRLWIQHLALNGLGNGGYARSSFLGGLQPRSKEPLFWEYLPVENSKEILGPLLQKYWQGLIKPLHFFPETSWDYLQACVVKSKPVAEGLRQAQKTWEGNEYESGDGQDPYYRLCFEGTDPLDGEFQELAGEVLGPLLEHLRKA